MKKAEKKPAGKAPAKAANQAEMSAPKDEEKKKKKLSKSPYKGLVFRSSVKRIARNMDSVPAHISSSAIEVLSCIAIDVVENIADCAAELTKKVNKRTIGSDDITAAFEICFRGELRSKTLDEIKHLLEKSQGKPVK